MALGTTKAKAPTKGLSKLNSMAFGLAVYASPGLLPHPTQNSLPAAGQALPGGLSTRRVPTKGFKAVSLHLILPSQALLVAKLSSLHTNGIGVDDSCHAHVSRSRHVAID